MAQQTLANHTRIDPVFHFFIVPVFLMAWIVSIVQCVRHFSFLSAVLVVFLAAALTAVIKIRSYALKVQDRVIRLEERLRLTAALPEHLRPQIAKLTEAQLIAIRFACDGELPALVERVISQNLSPKEIKTAIQTWRPDHWRV